MKVGSTDVRGFVHKLQTVNWVFIVFGTGIVLLVKHQTGDNQKVAGLIPSRSSGRMFFSGVNIQC